MPYERSHELMSRESSRLLIIDMQEKLLPAIPVREQLLTNQVRLIAAAKLFGVPISVTEQYPRGLGPTAAELRSQLPGLAIRDKVRFSAAECLGWGTAAESIDARHQVVVAGIEAHVCVLQTVLDLLAGGFQVFVVGDAVGSRSKLNWEIAFRRMSAAGAIVSSTESVLFEWCEVAGSPEFKQISQLIKG